jgi:hypothetical protein
VKDINVVGGDTLRRELRFRRLGVPVDLSAWTFTAQWRPNEGSMEFLNFTVDSTGLSTGLLVLSMTGAQTATIRSGVFDVQIDGAQTYTLLVGRVNWKRGVTRGAA